MKRWFGPKMIGFGFSPYSWEGWVVTAVFAAGIFGAAQLIPAPAIKFGLMGILLAVFAVIAALTYRDTD